jgi:hypothetical protein
MVEVRVVVPKDRVAELYTFAAQLTLPPATESTTPDPGSPWTDEDLGGLSAVLLDEERELLLRVAEARGRRVPLSRLSSDLGLPTEACLEQDFPGLTAFCRGATPVRAVPVLAGGSGDTAWYWMDPRTSRRFLGLTLSGQPPA